MSEEQAKQSDDDRTADKPPIGGRWRNLYAAVLITLAVLVILFYAFTRSFA